MLALSVRQPYAELILRGVKTVEYRSRATRIIGQEFYIYAAKGAGTTKASVRQAQDRLGHEGTEETARRIWSDDLAVPGSVSGGQPVPPQWMMELAELLILDELPTGVIVGSAVIEKCMRCEACEACEARRHGGTEARREGQGQRREVNSLIPDPSCTTSCLRAFVPSCLFAWHLARVERARKLRKPARQPQPVWFNLF